MIMKSVGKCSYLRYCSEIENRKLISKNILGKIHEGKLEKGMCKRRTAKTTTNLYLKKSAPNIENKILISKYPGKQKK